MLSLRKECISHMSQKIITPRFVVHDPNTPQELYCLTEQFLLERVMRLTAYP